MSYCDFNINLFNQFTSGKQKINPALSDDWELIDRTNIIRDGIALESKKLNTTVYDIPMRRYLRFCKMENITVIGNLLQGTFAVGQDRSVYSKKDFEKWTDKWNTRTENIISVKDAKAGHIYKTVCGLSVIYLGAKYVAKVSNLAYIENKSYTKISKVHYIHASVDFDAGNPSYGIHPKGKYKFIRDMGYALSQDEIASVFKHYYYNDMNIVYFADTLKKDPEYGYIDVKPFEYFRIDYKTKERKYSPYNILFSYVNKIYYKTRFSNTRKDGSTEYNANMVKGSYNTYGYGYSSTSDKITPEKFCRIGIVN